MPARRAAITAEGWQSPWAEGNSSINTTIVVSMREATMPQLLHNPLWFSKRTETFVTDPAPRFGFVAFAETWNGRLAMLGFVIGLGTELLTGQGILQQIGLG